MFASYIRTLGRNYVPSIKDVGDIAGAFPLYFDQDRAPGVIFVTWDPNLLKEIHTITGFSITTIHRAYTDKFEKAIQDSPYVATRSGDRGYFLKYKKAEDAANAAQAQEVAVADLNLTNISNNVPGNVMREVMANIHSGKSRKSRKSRKATRRRSRKMRR